MNYVLYLFCLEHCSLCYGYAVLILFVPCTCLMCFWARCHRLDVRGLSFCHVQLYAFFAPVLFDLFWGLL